jgi:leader peptidase (prepilin peptidase) / N-methyltransferase
LPHLAYIIFFFAIGACVGSFLNVVVWRLPRGESLITPPSHCPKCNRQLKWYDNLPIIGWIKLGGRCRFCRETFSVRYPIVEAITACLFVFYYIAYYILQWRSCSPLSHPGQFTIDELGRAHPMMIGQWVLADSWPIYVLYMILISGLLAASLIDAELYIIPLQIPWVIAALAFLLHAFADRPSIPGSLNLVGEYAPSAAAFAAGGIVGLAISVTLWALGLMPTSFPEGEPLLEVDRKAIDAEIERAKSAGEAYEHQQLPPPYTPKQIRIEIGKEILFLLPPLILAGAWTALTLFVPALKTTWANLLQYDWFNGLLGSFLGALLGAFIVWIFRILGTLALRRVAMGLGDVHLMFAVGAVIGAGGALVAFFIAPAFGILIAIYMLITRKGREMPLGPYLSLATAIVMLCYCPIAAYLSPGLQGLLILIGGWFGHA